MDFDDKQIIYVSSLNRTSGISNDFLYSFTIDQNAPYDHIGVLAASIPKSYYLIDDYNDTFTLSESGVQVVISIPHGNYTLTAWKNILANRITIGSPHGWIYSVSSSLNNSVNTGYLTFTVTGNGGIQPIFIFGEALYVQMGFDQSIYHFVANSLTSINVINLQLINALLIHCDLCDNRSDSVLQDIYSNTADYSYITYQSTELLSYAKPLTIKNNWVCRFYLTDNENNPINLNGLEWNMTVIFFKKNDIFNMIKNFIKLSILQQ